jgi:hypothetical protein
MKIILLLLLSGGVYGAEIKDGCDLPDEEEIEITVPIAL